MASKNTGPKAPKADTAPKAAVKASAKADSKAPKAPAAPKAPKADTKAPKANGFALHLNKTGRLCIGKDAAARMGDAPFCKLTVEGKIVRLEPTKKEIEGDCPYATRAVGPTSARPSNSRPWASMEAALTISKPNLTATPGLNSDWPEPPLVGETL